MVLKRLSCVESCDYLNPVHLVNDIQTEQLLERNRIHCINTLFPCIVTGLAYYNGKGLLRDTT